jgi:hypothetical protein
VEAGRVVIAYKFLARGAVGPVTRHRWSPGQWVEAVRVEEGFGVHACRVSDLAFWIADELWRIDLEGQVRERATQVEASRGRLLDRVEGWDRKAWAELGLACVFQTRDVSAAALRGLGQVDAANRLAAPTTFERLVETVRSSEPPEGFAGEMFGYAHDAAVAFSITGNAAESSFIASVATAAARGDPAGFDDEKRRESGWLASRLAVGPA